MSSTSKRIRPYPISAMANHSSREATHSWELTLFGDLGDKQSDLLARFVEVPRNSRGTLFFDTGGGSVYTGLALATLIRLRGLEIDGVVAGECSSAALLPFAACKRRFVTPHSTLLFHPIRWQSDDDVRYEEAAEWARHFALMEKDIDKLIAKLFNHAEEKLAEWTRPGRFVTGQELVDAGLAEMVDLFEGDVWSQIEKIKQKEKV
jgi:ATP-dependent Clp protease, protease subunit